MTSLLKDDGRVLKQGRREAAMAAGVGKEYLPFFWSGGCLRDDREVRGEVGLERSCVGSAQGGLTFLALRSVGQVYIRL